MSHEEAMTLALGSLIDSGSLTGPHARRMGEEIALRTAETTGIESRAQDRRVDLIDPLDFPEPGFVRAAGDDGNPLAVSELEKMCSTDEECT